MAWTGQGEGTVGREQPFVPSNEPWRAAPAVDAAVRAAQQRAEDEAASAHVAGAVAAYREMALAAAAMVQVPPDLPLEEALRWLVRQIRGALGEEEMAPFGHRIRVLGLATLAEFAPPPAPNWDVALRLLICDDGSVDPAGLETLDQFARVTRWFCTCVAVVS